MSIEYLQVDEKHAAEFFFWPPSPESEAV